MLRLFFNKYSSLLKNFNLNKCDNRKILLGTFFFIISIFGGISAANTSYASDSNQNRETQDKAQKDKADFIRSEYARKIKETVTTKKTKPKQDEERAADIDIYRTKKLLHKTIKDLDAYRLMLQNIGAHNDDSSRILLAEEAGKYLDKFVNPLLEDSMSELPEMQNIMIALKFFKACIFYESGDHSKYWELLDSMKKQYGEKYQSIAVFVSSKDYEKYQEMVKGSDKTYGDKYLGVAVSSVEEGFNTIGEAIHSFKVREAKKSKIIKAKGMAAK